MPLWMGLVLSSPAADLAELQASYEQRGKEAKEECQIGLNRLRASYREALLRHLEKVKASGKLELVLPVSEEISAVEQREDGFLPALPEQVDEGLAKMRDAYETAGEKLRLKRSQALVELANTMDEALAKREADWIRAGDIEEAKQARAVRDGLAKDPELVAARKELGAAEEAAQPGLGGWVPLLSQKMEVVSKGHFASVGKLAEVIKDKDVEVQQMLAGNIKAAAETVLLSEAPSVIQFRFAQRMSKMRGQVALAIPNGDATIRIKANDEKVFETRVNRQDMSEKFDLTFPMTKSIEIEVDMNGHPGNDFVYWTGLEVR